jgi:hypothetical protein
VGPAVKEAKAQGVDGPKGEIELVKSRDNMHIWASS